MKQINIITLMLSWPYIIKISIVIAEVVAAIAWSRRYNTLTEVRLKLLCLFLCFIGLTELINFFYNFPDSLINQIVIRLNTALEFIFWIYFLTCGMPVLKKVLLSFFVIVLLCEQFGIITTPANFNSVSAGIGSLSIMGLLIFNMFHVFQSEQYSKKDDTWLFFIFLGIALFYVGAFPYHNFRNILWQDKQYYQFGYILHYITQVFCIFMYFLIAFAAKWKKV